MGGPWRARGFDPAGWRPPTAHVEAHPEAGAPGRHDYYVVGIVIGYLASVVTSIAIMLTLMKSGW
ncbi:MAG: hypothetical protein HY359_08195 [Candidatus Rokubacteria bacterium]|nr:hypothetical protein [Candidatus Rokubacteria bacterium]